MTSTEPTVRVPTEAERLIAAAVMRWPDDTDDVRATLTADDFLDYPARLVYATCCDLLAAGTAVGMDTVYPHLQQTDRLADLGDRPHEFLADLWESVPTAANAGYAAGLIREAAERRRLVAVAYEMIRAAGDGEPPDHITARAAEQLASADARAGADGPATIRQAVAAALTRYDDFAAGRTQARGIPSGFDDLDALCGGWRPGQLVVPGARPGVGKSALALRFAGAAAGAGFGAMIFSLEMSAGELTDRMMASAADVPLARLRGAAPIDGRHLSRVLSGTDELARLNVLIDDRAGRPVQRIGSEARRAVRRHGVRLVVVDSLHLVAPENRKDPRHLQVEQVSRSLKMLARSAGVAVVAMAQLNRKVESRGDGRPRLSDLRDSGSIEMDADIVALLHRTEGDDSQPVHLHDLIVAKCRNGPTGTVSLQYRRAVTRFETRHPAP